MVCSNSDIDLYRNKQHFKLADIVIARDHCILDQMHGKINKDSMKKCLFHWLCIM